MEKKRNLWVIPTGKPSRLLMTIPKGNLILSKSITSGSHWENQHIYITNDEEIKDCYYLVANSVQHTSKAHPSIWNNKPRKIILTTDTDLIKEFEQIDQNNPITKGSTALVYKQNVQSIPDDFLEWFVNNSSCEFVEVREEEVFVGFIDGNGKKPIYDDEYKIIIPKDELAEIKKQLQIKFDEVQKLNSQIGNFGKPQEEPKEETLEEAAELYLENVNTKVHKDLERDGWMKIGFIGGAKWQAERMYSEEDMRLAIKKARDISDGKDCFDAEDISGCTEVCTYDWKFNMSEDLIIEQFKKK